MNPPISKAKFRRRCGTVGGLAALACGLVLLAAALFLAGCGRSAGLLAAGGSTPAAAGGAGGSPSTRGGAGQAGASTQGEVILPASVKVDYDHTAFFQKYLAPGRQCDYLIFVTSQVGGQKVSVYGFLKPK